MVDQAGQSSRRFTLVEIMVTVALIIVIMGFLHSSLVPTRLGSSRLIAETMESAVVMSLLEQPGNMMYSSNEILPSSSGDRDNLDIEDINREHAEYQREELEDSKRRCLPRSCSKATLDLPDILAVFI